jgi:hypothetical protein
MNLSKQDIVDETDNGFAIAVVSYDGYSDVWPAFINAYNKYFRDSPFQCFLINNELDVEYVNIIHTGAETNWCDRAEAGISKIKSENIILLLDDYLIGEEIDLNQLYGICEFFNNNHSKYLRLMNMPRVRASKNSIAPIYSNEVYGINLQPSIWNKEYLIEKLNEVKKDRSAWGFELSFVDRVDEAKKRALEGHYAYNGNVLNIHNGILKGKWFPKEVKYFQKRDIPIDTSARETLTKLESMSYNMRAESRNILPRRIRIIIKPLLKNLGFSFYTEK